MGIRNPLKKVLDYDDVNNVGATSVAGFVTKTFRLPQDSTNVVVKYTESTVGGGGRVTLQTTDDGGTTWYDVASTSLVSNATNATAEWITMGTISNAGAIGSAVAGGLAGGAAGIPNVAVPGVLRLHSGAD